MDGSGNFPKFLFVGPVVGPGFPYFSWKYFKKYKKTNIFSHLNFLELQHFDIFWTYQAPIFFVSYSRNSPQQILPITWIWGVFHGIILDNPLFWKNAKSEANPNEIRNIFKKCGPFVPEPGMWWNLDIFGKFAFDFFGPRGLLVFMENHFLNFSDFQNPLTRYKQFRRCSGVLVF